MKFKFIILVSCILECSLSYAATPLVEFTQQPSLQYVRPGQSALVFYTIRNNTPVTFPITISASALMVRSNVANTCGNTLPAHSSCNFTYMFNAPNQASSINARVSVDYQGRAPLVTTTDFNVNANIYCSLLPIFSYQTSFCQQQYQNVVTNTFGVINPYNINTQEGQTPGAMFGIYKRSNGSDLACFVSCGVRKIGGTAPDENTMFELASVTKTFTAAILGKKQNQGLDVQASVNPDMPTGTWNGESYNLNPSMQPVTYSQLATFAGGVCFSDAPDVVITNPSQLIKQSDFVKDINLLDRNSPTCLGIGPNVRDEYSGVKLPTHNFYSNSSVGLVAQILMGLDGYTDMTQPEFNDWLCQHITVPLNMPRTSACLPSEATSGNCTLSQIGPFCINAAIWTTNEYSTGYRIINGSFIQTIPFPFVPWYGAGNIRSNALEMVNFIKANLDVNDSVDPLAAEIIAGMQTAHVSRNYLPVPPGDSVRLNVGAQNPLRGGQGYAWVCDPINPDPTAICGKLGGHDAYQSFIGFQRSKSYGVIILFNAGNLGNQGSLRLADNAHNIGNLGVTLIQAAP